MRRSRSTRRFLDRILAAHAALLVVASVAEPARADAAQTPIPFAGRASPRGATRSTVLTDVSPEGSVWAVGSDYKLRADLQGVELFPRPAPDHELRSLRFRLVAATWGGLAMPFDAQARPRLYGDRVEYARGAFRETWDLRWEEVEQSFRFDRAAGEGDLVLSLAVDGGLEYAGRDGGLVFRSDAGGLRIGDLTVVDAAGRRLDRELVRTPGGIELRVSADYLERACYPLVIDPVIRTVLVDPASSRFGDFDAAFDPGHSSFVVVWSENFGSGDSDVYCARLSAGGILLDQRALDISADMCLSPAIAHHRARGQYLMVWEKWGTSLFDNAKILGRTRSDTSATLGATFVVRGGLQVRLEAPDVGAPVGDPSVQADRDRDYLVVWEEYQPLTGNSDVLGRRVDPGGELGPILAINTDLRDQRRPAITQTSGAHHRWLVAYEDEFSPNVPEIHAAILDENGAFQVRDFFLDAPQGSESLVDVDGDGREFLAVWNRHTPNDSQRIVGCFVEFDGVQRAIHPVDLTRTEPGTLLDRVHGDPRVARIAGGYLYGYTEHAPFTSDALEGSYVASLRLFSEGGTFRDGHVPLSTGVQIPGLRALAGDASSVLVLGLTEDHVANSTLTTVAATFFWVF